MREKLAERAVAEEEDNEDMLAHIKNNKRRAMQEEAASLTRDIKMLGAKADSRHELQGKRDSSKEARDSKGKKAFVVGDVEKDEILSAVEQKRREFKAKMKRTQNREVDTLSKLNAFKSKISSAVSSADADAEQGKHDKGEGKDSGEIEPDVNADDEEAQVERDLKSGGWMSHQVKFTRRPQDFDKMARDHSKYEYSIFDPRDTKGLKHDLPPREHTKRRKEK